MPTPLVIPAPTGLPPLSTLVFDAVFCACVISGMIFLVRRGSDLLDEDRERIIRWEREAKDKKWALKHFGEGITPEDLALVLEARLKMRDYEDKARTWGREERARIASENGS